MAGTIPSLGAPGMCRFPGSGRLDGCHGTEGNPAACRVRRVDGQRVGGPDPGGHRRRRPQGRLGVKTEAMAHGADMLANRSGPGRLAPGDVRGPLRRGAARQAHPCDPDQARARAPPRPGPADRARTRPASERTLLHQFQPLDAAPPRRALRTPAWPHCPQPSRTAFAGSSESVTSCVRPSVSVLGFRSRSYGATCVLQIRLVKLRGLGSAGLRIIQAVSYQPLYAQKMAGRRHEIAATIGAVAVTIAVVARCVTAKRAKSAASLRSPYEPEPTIHESDGSDIKRPSYVTSWRSVVRWPPLWAVLILAALAFALPGYLLRPPAESQSVLLTSSSQIQIAVDKPGVHILADVDATNATNGSISLNLYANNVKGGFMCVIQDVDGSPICCH
jgi:hypothetical protein